MGIHMSKLIGVPKRYRKFSARQALIGLLLAILGFIVAILITVSQSRH
jgi:hypothetical protein